MAGHDRKLSERGRIKRLEGVVETLMVEIPERVNVAIARMLKPLRMELDLISLIIKEKTGLTQDEADSCRRRLLIMHAGLDAAASIGSGFAALGQCDAVRAAVLSFINATPMQTAAPVAVEDAVAAA